MEIPQGNTWKIAENRTPKMGFKSPPEHLARVIATSKWLKVSYLRHRQFYVYIVIIYLFSLFATQRSHFLSSRRALRSFAAAKVDGLVERAPWRSVIPTSISALPPGLNLTLLVG